MREGPTTYTRTYTVCDGCKYFEPQMKSRGWTKTEDYWYCTHKDAHRRWSSACGVLRIGTSINRSLPLSPPERYIGEGSGSCPTPGWCPLLTKG